MTPILPLIIAAAALLVLSIGLAAALWRRSRLLREQIERVAALEEDQERRVREDLARRLDRDRRQLQREHEARKAEFDKTAREQAQRQTEIAEKRQALEERAVALDSRAEDLAERAGALDARSAAIDERERRIGASEDELRRQLEATAKLTTDEARAKLLAAVEAAGEFLAHAPLLVFLERGDPLDLLPE